MQYDYNNLGVPYEGMTYYQTDGSYPPQFQYDEGMQGLFDQYHPFQEGYPTIIGFQQVPVQDESGLFVITDVPIYGYPETPPNVAKEKPNDIELPKDRVGYAAAPAQQSAARLSNHAVTEFFQTPAPQKPLDYQELLKKYLAKVSTADPKQYLPFRYQAKFQKLDQEKNTPENVSFSTWNDALLHEPPMPMLQSLNKLQGIETTSQNSGLPTYLFPCSISIPERLRTKYGKIRQMQELIAHKDHMVLEVVLTLRGDPIHVFIRPILGHEGYLEKKFGDDKEKVRNAILSANFPALTRENASSKQYQPTLERPVVKTNTHFEFYCGDGVTIKAPRVK